MLNEKQPEASMPGGVDGYSLQRRLIRVKEVYIPAAAVKTLNATSVTLVSNTDTKVALIFHGATEQLMGGTANYDQNENTTVKYSTTGTIVSTTLANFLNGAADKAMSTLKPIVTDYVVKAGESLVLSTSASPYNAAGNRNLKVTVYYSAIDVE